MFLRKLNISQKFFTIGINKKAFSNHVVQKEQTPPDILYKRVLFHARQRGMYFYSQNTYREDLYIYIYKQVGLN